MNWRFWQRRDPWAVEHINDLDNRLAEMESRLDSLGTRLDKAFYDLNQRVLELESSEKETPPSSARIAELERQMAQLEQSALTYLRRGSARLKRAEDLEAQSNLDAELMDGGDNGDHPAPPPKDDDQMSLLSDQPRNDLASIREKIRQRRL